MNLEPPTYPALIKSTFKCGHIEMELAANLDEAIHLRDTAKYYHCTYCYVTMMKKGELCQQQPQAEPLTSAAG